MWPYSDSDTVPGWFDDSTNARKASTNIHDINELETGTEPVSLAVAKAHLRIDFTDDDTLITALLTSCRQAVEKFCNLSIVLKTMTVTMDLLHSIEIPLGPVQSVTSFVDNTSTAIDTGLYKVVGVKFQRIKPFNCWFYDSVLTYQAGYDGTKFIVEQDILLAILNEIAFRYENRGEGADTRKSVNPGICESSRILATPYQRAAWV